MFKEESVSGLFGIRFFDTGYVYNETGQIIGEYPVGVSNTPTAEYIYADSTPIAYLTSSAIYYIHSDQLDSPRVVTTTGGATQWNWPWQTNPFGEAQPTGTLTFNLRFPGQYYDAETGLHYNRARDYESSTARYVESDPAGIFAGVDTYAYVNSSPLVWTDTHGLANDQTGFRWAQCSAADMKECQEKCAPQGVESCRRRWMLATAIAGDKVVQGWKPVPNGLSCSCEEPFCDKNPNVCKAARNTGYAILGAVIGACVLAGTLVGAGS